MLARAADEDKDQTYFLYGLRQDQLWHSRFPLGDLTKPEVRDVARGLGLVDRRQAREPGDLLRARRRLPRASCGRAAAGRRSPGPVLDADGERVGEHGGAAGFTVGQRKGLGVALGEPRLRVARSTRRPTRSCWRGARTSRRGTIALEDGHVRRRRAARRAATRTGLGAVPGAGADPPPGGARRREVRPASPDEPARGGRWTVETDTPVWAIAPGQACVLYDGDACLGGGRIAAPARRPRTPPPSAACRGVRARMTIGPALPLALLVGLLHTRLYVLIRGDAGGRLPLTYVAASPRRVGRRGDRQPARASTCSRSATSR